MRLILAVLMGAASLWAQSWDELRLLHAGDRVKVVDSSSRVYKGTFRELTEQSISLAAGGGPVSIERPRVVRVQLHSSGRRARNILIGAGIGVAAGFALDQSIGRYLRNETGESTGARAAIYAVPIALFTGIGAALSPYTTVYRAH